MRGGPIEPSSEEEKWLFHYSPNDQWQGSLEQLWVWQNYLDLEKRDKRNGERSGLPRFVESVEEVLGENRRIFVEEGRVRVTTPYTVDGEEAAVRLNQLPSGEQQVLLLFGELARRRRTGRRHRHRRNRKQPAPDTCNVWSCGTSIVWRANGIRRSLSPPTRWKSSTPCAAARLFNLDYPEDRFNLPLSEAGANQS